MADDNYLTIIAQLQSGEFDKAAEAMGKRLQSLENGTVKYESAAQTANRRLAEHTRAINLASGAVKQHESFTRKMADSFTHAGLRLGAMVLGFNSLRQVAGKVRDAIQDIISHNLELKDKQQAVAKEFENLAVVMGEKFGPAISAVLEGMANAVRGITGAIDPVANLEAEIAALKASMEASNAITVDSTDYIAQNNKATADAALFISAETDALDKNNFSKSKGVQLQMMEERLAKLKADREKNRVTKPIKADMKEDPLIAIENKRREAERKGIAETLKNNFEKQKTLAELERQMAADSKERTWEILDAQIEADNERLKNKSETGKAAKQATLEGVGGTIAGLANLWAQADSNEKSRANKMRIVAMGQALIQTYLAASKAFAEFGGFPFGLGPMAASIAQGMVNVGVISSQKFAAGTRFAPGGMSLVGENGPELLNIPRGSRVINNAQSNNYNTGGINITVQGNATPETVRGLREAAREWARSAEYAARNGFMNKARLGLA